MNLVVHIPDDLGSRLGARDLERRALEALVLEGFRSGHLTKAELRHALGFEVLDQVDGSLKAHGVFEPYMLADIERERQTLDRLGI